MTTIDWLLALAFVLLTAWFAFGDYVRARCEHELRLQSLEFERRARQALAWCGEDVQDGE